MPVSAAELQSDDAAQAFLAERHLASLTSIKMNGDLHVVPVAFVWVNEEHTIRIVTRAHSVKVKNADAGSPGVLSFVDRGRWMSLHGTLTVRREPDRIQDTLDRYAARNGPARETDAERVSLELIVDFARGRW